LLKIINGNGDIGQLPALVARIHEAGGAQPAVGGVVEAHGGHGPVGGSLSGTDDCEWLLLGGRSPANGWGNINIIKIILSIINKKGIRD
jgi:hypothetical protein